MKNKNKTLEHKNLVCALITSIMTMGTGGAVLAQEASEPVSDGGITPFIIEGENEGGNRTCAEVGTAFYGDANHFLCSSARVNYNSGSFDDDFDDVTGNTDCDLNSIEVIVTEDTYVSWSALFGIGAVIVKGSDDANIYNYDPQATFDSGLASPINASGGPAGLSNLTFCWNPEEEEEPCPPKDYSKGYGEDNCPKDHHGYHKPYHKPRKPRKPRYR
jgi:hypothetical protein